MFDHILVEGEDLGRGAGNSGLIPSSHGQLLAEPSLVNNLTLVVVHFAP